MIDGQLTTIYLKSALCKSKSSGEDLAANCVNVLEYFDLTKSMLRDKLSSCVVDGAYIHMNISEHVYNNIGIQQNWLTISRDVAHLLKLTIGNTQKQQKLIGYK